MSGTQPKTWKSLVVHLAMTGVLLSGITGCTTLHSIQFGNIDSKTVLEGQRFEVLVSEVGFNIDEAAAIAAVAVASAGHAKEAGAAGDIIKLFQVGPRTGNPVFDEKYSDKVMQFLKLKCPSGQITGLTSIRESAKYPVVSGEIVKLVGYCKTEAAKK